MKRPPILQPITLLILFCALAATLSGCQGQPATAPAVAPQPASVTPDYWPTSGWRTSSPAEQGMDAAKLSKMLEAVKSQNLDLHSLLVIRNGVYRQRDLLRRQRPEHPHELYSCTKSFIATLIGIAIDKGCRERGRADGGRSSRRPHVPEQRAQASPR